ncbi:HAD family hydrolase [Streptosporangium sp. NPDC002544]|uniref:HAD family hydrolase n=1 Tax=Streptosporangium sp. NPDC002544 TaxID=3154538 RepID=UPI00331B0BC5
MEGLFRLRASGWRVTIVTNGTADNQFGKIQRAGLAKAVDAYALLGVEGIRKPDIGLFEVAAQHCGISLKGGGWMVGDSLVADIGGDRQQGCVRSGSTEALGSATITARIMSPPTCFRSWRSCTANGDQAAIPQPSEGCRTATPPYTITCHRSVSTTRPAREPINLGCAVCS